MKKYMYIVSVALLLGSCGLLIRSKPQTLDPKTGYFGSSLYGRVTVITDISVDATILKSLLVVPNDEYYAEMGKNLNYFEEVMTYHQLEEKMLELGDTLDLRFQMPDKLKLNRAAKLYKPFVILEKRSLYRDAHYVWVTGLSVYDPLRGEIIFENRIPSGDLAYIKGFYFPLFNSFLEYLRKQK
ncbi:hypothetical protein [Mangrovibacterium lignilyticum]|uniref:hypothetical protein n=1 Tax=Mangrovibacterium lignilyticum TaxID=2668052 RepID=UPI0013D20BD5|nr:hypothetical protein [Mangrovibacterium lignilyticum]